MFLFTFFGLDWVCLVRHLICLVVHGIGTIHEASNKKQKIAVENVFRFLCLLTFDIFYDVWEK